MPADATHLHFCAERSLPAADAVTQVYAVLARRGAGKTYAAMKLTEELLRVGAQVVIFDPVGVWWGLRLAADGAGPGFPVPVLGGAHADIPLESGGGAVLADFAVDTGASLVLDLSEFTLAEQRRFVTAFSVQLLQRKKQAKSPLLLVLEEAQEFVPQMVTAEMTHMLGALQRLVKLGRNFGIGAMLVSQRPQAVSKEVLSQAEVLLVGQLIGVPERATIKAWVKEKGELAGSSLDRLLPSLQQGQFYLWSPQWLGFAGQVKIAPRVTFDASSTPRLGEQQHVRALAKVDLGALSALMKETIDRAADHDPQKLRERLEAADVQIRELRGQLLRARDLDVQGLEAQAEQLVALAGVIRHRARTLRTTLALPEPGPAGDPRCAFCGKSRRQANQLLREGLAYICTDCIALANEILSEQRELLGTQTAAAAAPPPPPPPSPPPPAAPPSSSSTAHRSAGPPPAAPLKGPPRILWALASRRPDALSRVQVATLAGFRPDSGTFSNYLGELRAQGLLQDQGRLLAITEAGVRRLGAHCPRRAASTAELVELWKPKLEGRAKTLLDLLVHAYPKGLYREDLAQGAAMSATSGSFTNYLSALRVNGLLEESGPPRRRLLRASDTLFPTPEAPSAKAQTPGGSHAGD